MTAHANGTAAADPMSTQFGEPESYECKPVTACFVRKMFDVKLFWWWWLMTFLSSYLNNTFYISVQQIMFEWVAI